MSDLPSKTENNKFHPALAVGNVRNFIPIILEMETGQYTSWAELFKIHCRAYDVIEYIIPFAPPSTSDKGKEKEVVEVDKTLSPRLDAIVCQWIYGTISKDLLHTILKPNMTAQQAWERLANIFQDNKGSRAVSLENQFSQLHTDNFSNISAYCQELKMIADQLADVGSPVTDNRLVLQLIAGLNENYDNVASILS